jgi:molybdate transport system ATP-binding protein
MQFDVDLRKRVVAQGRAFDLDVSFRVESPRLALYGPSGAGKTLTLQMLAGLVRPDEGRIVVDGRPWFDAERGIDLAPGARRVGYVFQDYALFPHWTVARNVGAAFARSWPRPLSAAQAARVERALTLFDLADVRDSYPAQLSGGQRQRTALARALVGRPRVLLLDEPFAALDGMLRERVRDELLALQARHDVPLVMITHDPEDIRACAEAVVTLDAGRVAGIVAGPVTAAPPPPASDAGRPPQRDDAPAAGAAPVRRNVRAGIG